MFRIKYENKHKIIEIFGLKLKFQFDSEKLITMLIRYLYKKQKNVDYIKYISDHIKNKNLYVYSSKEALNGQLQYLQKFKPNNIVFCNERKPQAGETLILFGYDMLKNNIADVYFWRKTNPIFFIEAAYLRSVLMDRSNSKFDTAHCFFIDDIGFHYDFGRPSRIREVLKHKIVLNAEQLNRIKNAISLIHKNKLTKYNDQSIEEVRVGSKGRKKVLVIEQAKNDYAILKSGGSDFSFEKMLKIAIDENPNSDILIKIHPDTLNGKRGGIEESYYGHNLKLENQNIYKIETKVNPYSLIDIADKIYVFSSMFGIEGLLAGKEVHLFGNPIYGGCGCTIDYNKKNKKKVNYTIYELFWVLYFEYLYYVNENGEKGELEELINKLLDLISQYRKECNFNK